MSKIYHCNADFSFDGKIRNNEREELEDQITKYTKQIYQIENENKILQTRNIELTEKLEKVKGENPSLKFDLRAESQEKMDCGYHTPENLQQIVLELEERIEV